MKARIPVVKPTVNFPYLQYIFAICLSNIYLFLSLKCPDKSRGYKRLFSYPNFPV